MDLALFTVEELARELVGRSTFCGAVVWSQHEHRRDGQVHSDFRMMTSIPDNQGVIALCERVIDDIQCGDVIPQDDLD